MVVLVIECVPVLHPRLVAPSRLFVLGVYVLLIVHLLLHTAKYWHVGNSTSCRLVENGFKWMVDVISDGFHQMRTISHVKLMKIVKLVLLQYHHLQLALLQYHLLLLLILIAANTAAAQVAKRLV